MSNLWIEKGDSFIGFKAFASYDFTCITINSGWNINCYNKFVGLFYPLNSSPHEVLNVAVGDRTTLNQLFNMISEALFSSQTIKPIYKDFRNGDVRHSQADISKARKLIGYDPSVNVEQGIKASMEWYIKRDGGSESK